MEQFTSAQVPECAGVYFLYAPETEQVKIGYTRYLNERLKELQYTVGVEDGLEVELVLIIPGALRIHERRLHYLFRRGHVKGEWFRASKTLRRFVEEHRDRIPCLQGIPPAPEEVPSLFGLPLSPSQAGERLGVSGVTILDWIRKGKLPARRTVPRHPHVASYFVDPEVVEAIRRGN